MKRIFVFLLLSIFAGRSQAQLEFSSEIVSFDTIYSGQKIIKTVPFRNVSVDTIMIIDAKTSCGCFMVEWPKKPILPGMVDSLDLLFDSNGKEGYQNKAATIYLSDKRVQRLYLKGFVKPSLIEFSTKNNHILFQKEKPEYAFEIQNTGDSIIYIDKVEIYNNFPPESITFHISKNELKQNESSIITVLFGADLIALLNEDFETIEINVTINDCCGYTKSYKRFLISE